MSLPTRTYRRVIGAMAELLLLPNWFVYQDDTPVPLSIPGRVYWEAIVLTESAGKPWARRYERHQDRPSPKDGDVPGQDDGLVEDDASYGLMQVMGYNIRVLCGRSQHPEDGGRMHFGFALLPLTNLVLGIRVLLAELRATGGDVPRALARYNGGPTGDRLDENGVMRRQEYVDKVHRNALRVMRDWEMPG